MQSVTFAIALWVATVRLTAFLAQGSPRGLRLVVPHGQCIFSLRLLHSAQVAGMRLMVTAFLANRPPGRLFLMLPHGL